MSTPSASTSTPHPAQGPTRPVLALAAESLVAGSGRRQTVVGVVHARAFRHYREGLSQYLAIRLGDVEAARAALGQLRAVIAATDPSALVAPPGIRARLYREARRLAARRREQADGDAEPPSRARLPWRAPRAMSVRHAQRLQALRLELREDEAELLELRHARELRPDEIAFVVDQPLEEVFERLDAGTRKALSLLDESGGQLRRALLEAFALETGRASTIQLDGTNEWEPLPPGTVVGGRYEIEARVGTGAFGDVYRAKDTEVPGHVVALKLLHQAALSEQARHSSLRELQLIASVFHPSVVQFKDHGWHEGRLWFVMPWYEGETLESRIQRRPLSRAEARRIFEPLTRALATMHAAGIRHQDVKPDNIFLARIRGFGQKDDEHEEVVPILIDLGVAAKEAEMVVAGTPTYFAPEVAAQFAANVEHRPQVTPKADVFALALSLRNALEPETQQDVPAGAVETFIERRAREKPPCPESRDLRFLGPSLQRWMSLDAEERPTADELADELAVLTRPEERKRRVRRVLRWAVPLGLAFVAVLASVSYVLHARAEREQLEAQRARLEAEHVRKDLLQSRQQRRSLEQNVREVRERYEKSQMNREELTAQLGLTEDRLAGAREYGQSLRKKLKRTRSELSEVRQARERLDAELSQTSSELEDERQRGSRLERRLAHARQRAEHAQQRIAQLDGQLDGLRAKLDAEKAKSDRLGTQMDEAIAARSSVERELSRAKERLAELEEKLGSVQRRKNAPEEASADADPADEGGDGDG